MTDEKTKPDASTNQQGRLEALVMRHYSQGVCHDGAAILCDEQPMTPDEVIARLQAMETALHDLKKRYSLSPWIQEWADEALGA